MIKNFICLKGNSDKFWSIKAEGVMITTTYGKNNSYGEPKSTSNNFPTAEKCQSEAEKLIAGKLKEGYEEVNLYFEGVPVYRLKYLQDAIEAKSEKLDIDVCASDDLMKEICKMTWLKDLEISNVKNLPPEFGQLSNLDDLEIKYSQLLKSIPKEIGMLKNLTDLEINGTGITNLPEEIGQLTKLENLRISDNHSLKSIPSGIGNLQNLDDVYIQGNGGEKLELMIPKEIGNLKKITRLQLPSNNLKSIPPEIGNLKSLTELDLNFNHISILPKEIFTLENLETLELMYNKISELPKDLLNLENLTDLSLEGCSIKGIPEEILNEGIEAIKEHLSESKDSKPNIELPAVSTEVIEKTQKLYKDKIDNFVRTSKSKIYKPANLKTLDELVALLTGKTNKVPKAKIEDDYYFGDIVNIMMPFRDWTFIENRILAFITQDAWAYKKDKDGFFESFYRRLGKQIKENDDESLFSDIMAVLKSFGIKEDQILKHSLDEMTGAILNDAGEPTSFGRYLLSIFDTKIKELLVIANDSSSMKESLIDLFLRNKRKAFEPYLSNLIVIDNYEGSDGSHHVPYGILETLCKIDAQAYEHFITDLLPQTDCRSCIAEMGRLMLENYTDKYKEKVFEIVKNTLDHITAKKNKKGDDRYEFNWSLAERWTDGTPQYIDWVLKNYGKKAQEIIFKFVNDTKVLDLNVIEVVVRHLGQEAVDIAAEALNMSITSNDIAAHYRKLFPMISGLDYSKYHDKVWEIAKSEFKQVRQTACLALSKLDPAGVIPKAAELLNSKKSNEREAGIMILSLIRTEESIDLLKKLLDTEKNDDARDIIAETIFADDQILTLNEAQARVQSAAGRGKLDKPVAKWLDEKTLPKMNYTNGTAIDIQTIRFLLYRQSRQKEIVCDYEAKGIYPLIDKKTSGDFAFALLQLLIKNGGPKAPNRFALGLVGMLGDERSIRILSDLAIKTMNENACATLGLNISLESARELNKIIQFFRIKYPNVKNAATEAFNAIASKMGCTPFELSDKMIPDFGFTGLTKTLTIDGKDYQFRIAPDFKLVIEDADHKIIKSLPKNTPAPILSEVKETGNQIKEAVKQQKVNLEYYLVIQRKWDFEEWQAYFLNHALAFAFARNFIWASFEKNAPKTTFMINEVGGLINLSGNTVTCTKESRIGLVHPLDIDAKEIETWSDILSKKNLKPPFQQIDRPVYTPRDDEAAKSISFLFENTELLGLTFKSRAEKLGWRRGSVIDSGEVSSYRKAFENKQIEVFIKTHGLGVQFYDDYMTLGEFFFVKQGTIVTGSYTYDEPRNERDERLIKFSEVPKIVYSETLADLYSITKKDDKDE